MSKILCAFMLFLGSTLHNNLLAQEYKFLEIRNCQRERRTVTFDSQVRFFWKCVCGMSNLSKQKILHFSPNYKADFSFLQAQIDKIRKIIPDGFCKSYPSEFWYDNDLDEPTIWFTIVFAKKDHEGNITAFAAYRITFEGNNAHLDEQRMNPKITNVEFIFDRAILSKLAQRLKTLHEST